MSTKEATEKLEARTPAPIILATSPASDSGVSATTASPNTSKSPPDLFLQLSNNEVSSEASNEKKLEALAKATLRMQTKLVATEDRVVDLERSTRISCKL